MGPGPARTLTGPFGSWTEAALQWKRCGVTSEPEVFSGALEAVVQFHGLAWGDPRGGWALSVLPWTPKRGWDSGTQAYTHKMDRKLNCWNCVPAAPVALALYC